MFYFYFHTKIFGYNGALIDFIVRFATAWSGNVDVGVWGGATVTTVIQFCKHPETTLFFSGKQH